ncbi:MAG: hypothetical protein EBR82_64335 [Caulobacteraceae bacterium]|nr:hypothetical protein [Caulobacteraceae bacterium]
MVDGGEVGNATNTNYEATINISVKKGFYFGCLIPAADTSMNCTASYSDYMQCLMGTNQGASLNAFRDLFYYTTTYGTLSSDLSSASFTAEAASEAIQSAGLDEATQQNAALGIYPPERCEAIKSYIASCRNEYLRCKALILAAQTNDEADAVQFVAPPVPEGI